MRNISCCLTSGCRKKQYRREFSRHRFRMTTGWRRDMSRRRPGMSSTTPTSRIRSVNSVTNITSGRSRLTAGEATCSWRDSQKWALTVVPFGQGYKDMSPASRAFYEELMKGNIIHGGNPVMKWMCGNVVIEQDPAGNIKPTKAKSKDKIDGVVAAIMALDRCIRHEPLHPA